MPSKPLKAIKPMFQKDKWRILRGDLVQIMAGKDKGLTGRVLRVLRDTRFPRVIVEGRNLAKRHVSLQGAPGYVVSIEAPLHYSNVMVLDPITNKPVRTRWVYDVEAGQKLRMTRGKGASRSVIYPPSPHKTHPGPDTRVGLKDTPLEDAIQRTFNSRTDFSPAVAKLPIRQYSSTSYPSAGFAFGALTQRRASAACWLGFAASPLLARQAVATAAAAAGPAAWHGTAGRSVSGGSGGSSTGGGGLLTRSLWGMVSRGLTVWSVVSGSSCCCASSCVCSALPHSSSSSVAGCEGSSSDSSWSEAPFSRSVATSADVHGVSLECSLLSHDCGPELGPQH